MLGKNVSVLTEKIDKPNKQADWPQAVDLLRDSPRFYPDLTRGASMPIYNRFFGIILSLFLGNPK